LQVLSLEQFLSAYQLVLIQQVPPANSIKQCNQTFIKSPHNTMGYLVSNAFSRTSALRILHTFLLGDDATTPPKNDSSLENHK
jgi:hypothetical protein